MKTNPRNSCSVPAFCSAPVNFARAPGVTRPPKLKTKSMKNRNCPLFALALLALALTACHASAQSIYIPYSFTNFAGFPGLSGSTDGTGPGARFLRPQGVAVDAAGNLYVADPGNYIIRKITPAGVVTTIAGSAGLHGTNDGTGSLARFYFPRSVAVDGATNVYVVDTSNSTIRKLTPVGTNWVVTTLAGLGGIIGTNNGTGSAARFNNPQAAALDSATNLYVSDNRTIRKITPAGVVTTLAGAPFQIGYSNATGSAARFFGPLGLAVDSAGNIYAADDGNNVIRKITPGGAVTTYAGVYPQHGGDDGPTNTALFQTPDGVAVDKAGNVFVADYDNQTIRKISPGGMVSTLAGTFAITGSANGVGSAARFNYPIALAVDAAGFLYVADSENHRITKGTPPPDLVQAVSTDTLIPGGTGSFNILPRGASFDGLSLAFFGGGTGGQQGIYLQDRYVFSDPVTIADTNTPIPNGTGNFVSFLGDSALPPDPCVSGNNVAFYGAGSAGQRGIYVSWSGSLTPVADTQTAIPGGSGNFTGFAPVGWPPDPQISGENIAFHGEGMGGQSGVYAQITGTLVKIADTGTAIPGGTGNFVAYPPDPTISGASVAFGGSGSGGQQGLYLSKAGVLSVIADENTLWPPDPAHTFTGFPVDPTLSGDTAAFVGSSTGGRMGVFVKYPVDPQFPGDPLRQVADLQTDIPGGSGKFTGFGAVSISATDLAFLGTGTGGQTGIYDLTAGSLVKVVAVGDVLGGKTITGLNFTRTGLSGDPVSFQATFADGSQGLFTQNVIPPPFTLRLTAAEKSGNNLRLSFTSQAGHTYNVQGRANLVSGNWLDVVTNIPGGGILAQTTVSNAVLAPQQFYRLQQSP